MLNTIIKICIIILLFQTINYISNLNYDKRFDSTEILLNRLKRKYQC